MVLTAKGHAGNDYSGTEDVPGAPGSKLVHTLTLLSGSWLADSAVLSSYWHAAFQILLDWLLAGQLACKLRGFSPSGIPFPFHSTHSIPTNACDLSGVRRKPFKVSPIKSVYLKVWSLKGVPGVHEKSLSHRHAWFWSLFCGGPLVFSSAFCGG